MTTSELQHLQNRPGYYMQTFLGVPVYIDPNLDDVQKFQLSPSILSILEPYNHAAVESFNEWSRSFFGTESKVLVIQNPNNANINSSKAFIVGPKTYQEMVKTKYNTVNT